ncbi:MAG: pantoate--beta-alanine ligase, partial [Marinoscillum sp.]
MRVLSACKELTQTILSLKKEGKSIGFVPTMGALHNGHLSLIKRARDENDVVVVSIFVNPLQFNSQQDLDKYPRVLEEDKKIMVGCGINLLFTPPVEELYPETPKVLIKFGEMANVLEGEFRKGHFEGVGVVVSKFLHIVQPDRAYFGLKDLQQFILIKRMCADLSFPVEIIGVETVREKSGLALSSRNRRLSEEGRQDAIIISKGLEYFKSGIDKKENLNILLNKVNDIYSQ